VPVISTTLGAEGIEVEPGENILLADSSQETLGAIIALSENSDRRAKLIDAGRALVSERYDWSKVGATLVEHYQRLLGDAVARSAPLQ
jgi:polysaccharide biosynthesis protein PslH